MAMAERLQSSQLLRVTKDMTRENVKDLEFFLCQMHPPWNISDDGDSRVVFEQMKHRMIWVFDSEARKCNFTTLARYMEDIQRDDLGRKLRTLGKVRCVYLFVESSLMLVTCNRRKTELLPLCGSLVQIYLYNNVVYL